uniref:Biotin/lipoyl-binding protein n=1 Tax=Fervidicoccus fontis TaxID=683846 RepID=A0A7J3SJV1_9CREN
MSQYKVRVNGKDYIVKIVEDKGNILEVEVEGTKVSVSLESVTPQVTPMVQPEQKQYSAPEAATTQTVTPLVPAAPVVKPEQKPLPAPQIGGAVTAKVPGKVKEIKVAEGQQVQAGQVVIIVESMKMDIEMRANKSGTVKAIYVKPGQFVPKDSPLLLIE